MTYETMIRREDLEQLRRNWVEQEPLRGTRQEKDYQPVAKAFNPWGAGTWLLTELEPDSSLAFGLCDLGMGTPELGYVCLDELASIKLRGGLTIEQDIHFQAKQTIGEYASESRRLGYIRA